MESVESIIIAGCRPGSRDPFVSAKGSKTIDAQFGLTGRGDCAEAERTNSLRSDKVHRKPRASDSRAEQQALEFRMEMQISKKQALEMILKDYRQTQRERNLN